MSTKTILMCQGKGSLSHNNRMFTAKNIDSSRTANNIVFVCQEICPIGTEWCGCCPWCFIVQCSINVLSAFCPIRNFTIVVGNIEFVALLSAIFLLLTSIF